MWTIAAFYMLVHGGGFYSLDRVIGWTNLRRQSPP